MRAFVTENWSKDLKGSQCATISSQSRCNILILFMGHLPNLHVIVWRANILRYVCIRPSSMYYLENVPSYFLGLNENSEE